MAPAPRRSVMPKLISLLLVLFGFFCLGLGLILSMTYQSSQYVGIIAIGAAALVLWRFNERWIGTR